MKLDFGSLMRASRVRAGFSQEEMAHRMDYNQSDVSKFESGRKEPPITTFVKWFELTNCKEVMVAYLCGMDGIAILQSAMMQVVGG